MLRKILLFALGLPLVACATTDTEEFATIDQAQLTAIISTPDKCNQGVAPGNCVQAPVSKVTSSTLRWRVDGLMSAGEYAGATQMPYLLDMPTLGGYGNVLVNRVTNSSANAPNRDVLFVFLSGLTVPVDSHATPLAKFQINLDYARFEGADKYIASEDRRITVDLKANTLSEERAIGAGVAASWTAMATEAGLSFRTGGCRLASNGKSATCDGELQIPLPASVLTSPGNGFDPAIGMFVRHLEVNGAMPELPSAQLTPALTQRTLWETLIFGRPRGFPLKIMSWNVNRGLDPAFVGVSDTEIGKFLAKNDIVALQEVMNLASAQKIADAANVIRTAAGLKPFTVYGPIDMNRAWSDLLVKAADWVDETQAGLFVLTPLEAVRTGSYAFSEDDCRGDDCFRAHGVQFLRLIVNNPDDANPNCREGSSQHCPKPASGDDYVDFFNVALQSNAPPLCEAASDWDDIKPTLMDVLGVLPAPYDTILKWVVEGAEWLFEDDLHCDSETDLAVRDRQLVQVNDFIEKITSQAKDRPSIIAGDFNIDGRGIGAASYQQMLQKLRIVETVTAPTPPTDFITPNPADWDFDIDHGDLVRERADINFATGVCTGTVIGTNSGTANLSCVNDGKFDGLARTTYVLVRPPAVPSIAKTLTKGPTWMAATSSLPNTRAWSSPFPSNNGNTGAPPNRLSDRKPVVADVELVPMKDPPKYHTKWQHEAKLSISAIDATMYTDCSTCDDVDPRGTEFGKKVPMKQDVFKNPTECTNEHNPVWPVSSCLNNWFFTEKSTSAEFTLHVIVDEDDNSNPNDRMSDFTESRVKFDVGNSQGEFLIKLRNLFDPQQLNAAWMIKDLMGLERCDGIFLSKSPTAKVMARVCHKMDITEFPPTGP